MGIGVALAGQVPAAAAWLLSLYTFVRYASPDSLFMVDCSVILIELALFVLCVLGGGFLVLRGDRGFGVGLLAGWAAGIVATVAATVLVGDIAVRAG